MTQMTSIFFAGVETPSNDCLLWYVYGYTELQYPKIAKVFRLLIQLEHRNLNKKQFSSFMVLAYWIIGNLFWVTHRGCCETRMELPQQRAISGTRMLFNQHKGLYKQQQMGNTHQCPLHKEKENPSVRFWSLPLNFRAPMVENIRE